MAASKNAETPSPKTTDTHTHTIPRTQQALRHRFMSYKSINQSINQSSL